MKEADRFTIDEKKVPSFELMKRAGKLSSEFAIKSFKNELVNGATVVCGGGNNGGDGFIVANELKSAGYNVKVLSLKKTTQYEGDAKLALELFKGNVLEVPESGNLDLPDTGLIVDALFGTGFTGVVKGAASEVIRSINLTKLPILSIDIPSGLDACFSDLPLVHVQATKTLAIQNLKTCHVLNPSSSACGEISVCDIGIDSSSVSSVAELIDISWAKEVLTGLNSKKPLKHKGERGHVCSFGGQTGMFGSIKLSARAALNAGAGISTIVTSLEHAKELSYQLEEVMCKGVGDTFDPKELKATSFVFGPGIGSSKSQEARLKQIVETAKNEKISLVIDACGINLINDLTLAENIVITPHPGEMARLIENSVEWVNNNRIKVTKEVSAKLSCWCLLKGPKTVISSPKGEVFINPADSPLLATAGSGDVLSGLIAGLMARGLETGIATRLGAFLHGVSGELLGDIPGPLAGDISSNIPKAVKSCLEYELDNDSCIRAVLPGCLPKQLPKNDN